MMINTKGMKSIVSIIGGPNVGKSTLLNKILKTKTSATSKKKHTTCKQVVIDGRKLEKGNTFFIDTPGIFLHKTKYKKLKDMMNFESYKAMDKSDMVLFVI